MRRNWEQRELKVSILELSEGAAEKATEPQALRFELSDHSPDDIQLCLAVAPSKVGHELCLHELPQPRGVRAHHMVRELAANASEQA